MFETYEMANMGDFHRVYANWLVDIDLAKLKSEHQNRKNASGLKQQEFQPSSSNSLFITTVIPYLKMIIIKSHKKVLIEELCEKYMAEVFSDEQMDEETIVKVEGMIKDGVDLLFDNEVQTNVFRMDHRMS